MYIISAEAQGNLLIICTPLRKFYIAVSDISVVEFEHDCSRKQSAAFPIVFSIIVGLLLMIIYSHHGMLGNLLMLGFIEACSIIVSVLCLLSKDKTHFNTMIQTSNLRFNFTTTDAPTHFEFERKLSKTMGKN